VNELIIYAPMVFAGVLLVLYVMSAKAHEREISRLMGVNTDLMDRLMSRDFGEYRVARDERVSGLEPPEDDQYPASDDEAMVDFQMMGEEFNPEDFR
jgi:hypothetical protein